MRTTTPESERQSPIVVYGASGHGMVVSEILAANGVAVLGFVDDARTPGTRVLGLPVLGTRAWLAGRSARVALGIGDNAARAQVAASCKELGAALIACVHPAAVVAPSASIGEGCVIMAAAVVNTAAQIGRGAIVNTGAIIEHENVIGEFAHVSPGCTLAGCVEIESLAHVGAGATVLQGRRVGQRSIVGAGAVVTRDVPPDEIVTGIPARIRQSR